MIFGGASSAVAIADGKRARLHDRIYFGTVTYSNATTRKNGHTHIFRETYNSWMAAKVLSNYLSQNHANDRYFYLSANYTWGTSTEESIRLFTNTRDTKKHPRIRTSFPRPRSSELREALKQAKDSKASVLVLVQFGKDMVTALDIANTLGIQNSMTIVVPTITLGMAQLEGPSTMQGIIGSAPWKWNVPYEFKYTCGIQFVENFKQRYETYPSSSAGSAYTIVWEYKDAVERANSFDTNKVITALEGHSYQLLKDKQTWIKFDHQSIQTVYTVRIKPRGDIIKDEYHSDFFEIIDSLPAEKAAQIFQEWKAARKKSGKPAQLE